jgi:acetyl-CoA carboxylase carboxyl transferase subunit alpha
MATAVFADDKAILAGLAYLDDMPVTVYWHEKGVSTQEESCPQLRFRSPGRIRKALRLMKQAEKFQRPVICIVDTAGAYCGIGAEEGMPAGCAGKVMRSRPTLSR